MGNIQFSTVIGGSPRPKGITTDSQGMTAVHIKQKMTFHGSVVLSADHQQHKSKMADSPGQSTARRKAYFQKRLEKFTLMNKNRMEVQLLNYGAIISSIKVPDR